MNWPLAVILATCVQSILVIQLFVEETSRRFGLDEDWLGILAASETGAAALTSLLVFLRPQLWKRNALVIAGFALLLGNFGCLFATTVDELQLARTIMGASAGVICSWAYRQALMCDDSAKAQGTALMLQSLLLVISFIVVPRVAHFIDGAVFWMCGFWFALMIIALMKVDTHFQSTSQSTPTSKVSRRWLPSLAFFVGVVAMYASHGSFDTFIAELGTQAGVGLIDIGNAMVAACAIGIPAGALATGIGARLGIMKPIWLAIGAMLIAILMLTSYALTTVLFWIVAVAYNFGWVLAFPFIILAADYLKDGGRMASGILMMQALGMALGALLAGYIAEMHSITYALGLLVPICIGLSALSFYVVSRKKEAQSIPAAN
ncbi:MAG: hypothetical protein P1U57_01975 [Oleibacter sp.]|nr:hypothetical protein [Thalassolituus sp.]